MAGPGPVGVRRELGTSGDEQGANNGANGTKAEVVKLDKVFVFPESKAILQSELIRFANRCVDRRI
jgi:hypothetical protein